MPENISIDVIANFNTNGRIKPMWIRLETEEQTRETCQINKIYRDNFTNKAGFKAHAFECGIELDGVEKRINITYYLDTQQWFLIS